MKACKRCGEVLPLDMFYVHSRMDDGHLSFCKECTKKRVTKHRDANLDQARTYDRLRYNEHPHRYEMHLQAGKLYKKRHPEKRRAHSLVGNAIRDGRLMWSPCEVCGAKRAQAHHDDYSKPLDVRWLCKPHHDAWHRANPKVDEDRQES